MTTIISNTVSFGGGLYLGIGIGKGLMVFYNRFIPQWFKRTDIDGKITETEESSVRKILETHQIYKFFLVTGLFIGTMVLGIYLLPQTFNNELFMGGLSSGLLLSLGPEISLLAKRITIT